MLHLLVESDHFRQRGCGQCPKVLYTLPLCCVHSSLGDRGMCSQHVLVNNLPLFPIPSIDPAMQYGGHCVTKSRGSANKRSIDVYHSVIINLLTVKQRVYVSHHQS